MKSLLFSFVPEVFLNDSATLNELGVISAWLIWAMIFLWIGILLGSVFFRKNRKTIRAFEKENKRGHQRLAIYQSTVEKQTRSY